MGFWQSLLPVAATGAGLAVGGPAGAMIGGAVGGAIAGQEKARRQREIEDQTRKMRAAEIRASPWTGRGPSTGIEFAGSEMGETLGGGLAGGVTGASIGAAFPKWGGLLSSKENPSETYDALTQTANVPKTYAPTMLTAQNQGGAWDQMYKRNMLGY